MGIAPLNRQGLIGKCAALEIRKRGKGAFHGNALELCY
jgi:hypothetical protein